MNDDEAAIIARVAVGDQGALRALYDAYCPRLRRFLWRLLDGDPAAVEDCLQETFIAVWKAAATFRGEGRVAAWLFRIASNAAAHARRHAQAHPATALPADDSAGDEALADAIPLETEVLTRLELRDALANLPVKQRAALELVFLYGCTLEEAARILDIPIGTVKSRLHHARRELARALAATE
jgi:RNA polymerase sigma-70 factor (ECF subfamily)